MSRTNPCKERERASSAALLRSPPTGQIEYMKRKCAHNGRTITYMPFDLSDCRSISEERLVSVDAKLICGDGWTGGAPVSSSPMALLARRRMSVRFQTKRVYQKNRPVRERIFFGECGIWERLCCWGGEDASPTNEATRTPPLRTRRQGWVSARCGGRGRGGRGDSPRGG